MNRLVILFDCGGCGKPPSTAVLGPKKDMPTFSYKWGYIPTASVDASFKEKNEVYKR